MYPLFVLVFTGKL